MERVWVLTQELELAIARVPSVELSRAVMLLLAQDRMGKLALAQKVLAGVPATAVRS